MACLESTRNQKLGLVSISYQVGGGYPEGGYDYELTRRVSQLTKSLPIRFAAVYVCFNDSIWKTVADFIAHVVSPILRVRLRSIQGSHQEVHYKLMALGIPNHAIPVTQSGEPVLYNHMSYLQKRVTIETTRLLRQQSAAAASGDPSNSHIITEPFLGIVVDDNSDTGNNAGTSTKSDVQNGGGGVDHQQHLQGESIVVDDDSVM